MNLKREETELNRHMKQEAAELDGYKIACRQSGYWVSHTLMQEVGPFSTLDEALKRVPDYAGDIGEAISFADRHGFKVRIYGHRNVMLDGLELPTDSHTRAEAITYAVVDRLRAEAGLLCDSNPFAVDWSDPFYTSQWCDSKIYDAIMARPAHEAVEMIKTIYYSEKVETALTWLLDDSKFKTVRDAANARLRKEGALVQCQSL